MIVYGMRASPFVRKVLLFIAEKGLAAESVPVGFGRSCEAFAAASPFRKMPAMTDGDFAICDSSAIIAYVEAQYPDPALIPAAPQARARAIWFDEFADTIMQPAIQPLLFNRVVAKLLGRPADLALADEAEREKVPPTLDYLEECLADGDHLVGNGLTLADLAAASPLIGLGYASDLLRQGRWPGVEAWMARLTARPSFAQVLDAEQTQMKALQPT